MHNIRNPDRSWLYLVLIMVAAMAARAWLLFGTQYVPGMNGAYYLVQARSIIERGVLGIPDMPLTFYLQAGVSWLLAKFSGMAQADAIMFGVKLCDSIFPPLLAWSVFVLMRRWSVRCGQSNAVALSAAALVCLAAPWLRMAGDLQKNSLALVWLAALVTALHGWLDEPSRKRGLAVLACLPLIGLTHIGVFGAAVVLISAVMLVSVIRQGFVHGLKTLPWLTAGVILLSLAAAVVLWKFDPSRIHRLITALTNPAKFSADGMQTPMSPGGAMSALRRLPSAGFAAAVIPALIVVWRRRKELPSADAAIVAGCSVTVLALTGPWFSMDKSMRFNLIALFPAIVVVAFAVLHIATAWRRRCILGLAVLIGLGGTVSSLQRGDNAILTDAAMGELQSLAKHIVKPERTLVCARHGAEWWCAWFLHTRIAQAGALQPEDWQRYDAVFFLEIKSGLHMAGGGHPPGFGSPPSGLGPPGFGPPPGGVPHDMPPQMKADPMMSASIPSDAEVLHDGECLKFARVTEPPVGILRKSKAVDL